MEKKTQAKRTPKRSPTIEQLTHDLHTQSNSILRQMEVMEGMSQHNQEMFEVVKNLAKALAKEVK
jgi:hypothetical protein